MYIEREIPHDDMTHFSISRLGDVHNAHALSLTSLGRAVQPQGVLRPGFIDDQLPPESTTKQDFALRSNHSSE